jgi:type I restriction enzyme S subunit
MKVDSWRSISLGDITSLVTSGSRDWAKHYSDSGSKFIRMTNLPRDGIYLKLNDMKYVDVKSNSADGKRTSLIHGDILISITAELGKIGWIPKGFGEAYINQHTALVRIKKIEATSKFIAYLLSSDMMNRVINLGNDSGAKAGLNLPSVKSVPIDLPPLPEQQKIAAILTSVDEVIEKTQAQIDKLKDLKTAMMQELLTNGVGAKQASADGEGYIPYTEFKDSPVGRIPKSWEVVILSDLITVMESGWSPLCESVRAQTGDWCVLKTTSVTWKGFDYFANKKLPENLEPRPNIQVVAEDILITRAGPADRVGVVVHVDYSPKKVMLSDKIIRIKTNSRSSSKFLSLWLGSSFSQKYLSSRVSGLASSQTNISQSILSKVPCVLPSLDEQIMIVNSLSALDKRIQNAGLKLNSQTKLKKALMQDLLTGKVRVKVES